MEFKPILTYAGDGPLFRSLEPQIAAQISAETSEFRRSYGRSAKQVQFRTVQFRTLDTKLLERYKSGRWSILENPVLHLFITDCCDVEAYKNNVKEEIDAWLKLLTTAGVSDWMIVIVETIDGVKKSKNILPRTSVLDKIRADFAAKSADRCVSILNAARSETRATESFRSMMARMRHLMLTAYNKNILRYEEMIRTQRDKRTQDAWNFVDYFMLQEELAFVLEMLGLYSEALIQYDELDAMFSQSVLNSLFVGERPAWLKAFEEPCNSFSGIRIDKEQLKELRQAIAESRVSLLKFRTYLLERQCTLLIAAETPWELAGRLMPFLHSTEREIEILRVEMPEGALACWQFVCALEVLHLCDQVQESKDIYKCSQHSAAIWNLAKDKLYELGEMCGLLPGVAPSSEHLHKVVMLSAGIGDDAFEDTAERKTSPSRKPRKTARERLKEALGSNQTFQKLYLELSELAISTYKHVSRLRFARLVGMDLGDFYCALDEPQKAIVFYTDLARELKTETWTFLSGQILLKLANCHKRLKDWPSYAKTCSAISCCTELEILDRMNHFDEFLRVLKTLEPAVIYSTDFEDHMQMAALMLLSETPVIQDSVVRAELRLVSNFPREIFCEKVQVAVEMCEKTPPEAMINEDHPVLPMRLVLDYKQDETLNCVSVACEKSGKLICRRSSAARRKASVTARADFSICMMAENVLLKPGVNIVELAMKATRVGCWSFKQLSIRTASFEFISEPLSTVPPPFEISTKASSAVLSFMNLIAGLEQPIKLIVSGGSFRFPKDASITLKCSKHLRLRLAGGEFQLELSIPLPGFQSFEERTVDLEAICDLLPGRKDDKQIEQKVSLACPWTRNELQIPLHFVPALSASCRLHSSGTKKFLQVLLRSAVDGALMLSDARMTCASAGVKIIDINPASQREITITRTLTVSYLFEIQVEPLKTEKELPVIQVDFSVRYGAKRCFTCTFDVMDYATLFRISARVEPTELCRVGSVCHLYLTITKMRENDVADLMYEVLADQNFWAMCGRSAGVVSMDEKCKAESIALDVMPLSAGFLPLPNIRLSKYISSELTPRLQPFQPGQVYNCTKSLQVHVLGNTSTNPVEA